MHRKVYITFILIVLTLFGAYKVYSLQDKTVGVKSFADDATFKDILDLQKQYRFNEDTQVKYSQDEKGKLLIYFGDTVIRINKGDIKMDMQPILQKVGLTVVMGDNGLWNVYYMGKPAIPIPEEKK